jgi:hypothetical protein
MGNNIKLNDKEDVNRTETNKWNMAVWDEFVYKYKLVWDSTLFNTKHKWTG